MGSVDAEPPVTETYDFVSVGAGVAGINTAYRLQSELPNACFTVLEGRGDMGGTWDFFKYPGLRSDSDLHTFGFSWEPWPFENPVAEADLILKYLHNCCDKHNLNRHFQFHNRVVAADWSSKSQKWTLTVEQGKEGETPQVRRIETTWFIQGTGYYDYKVPLKAQIPGLDRFQGKLIHPQFWPQDYDHKGKKVAIIGSGATAITLLPTLIKTAAMVTMVQRSPTYIIPLSNRSDAPWIVRKLLPSYLLSVYFRWMNILVPHLFVLICHYFPERARKIMNGKIMPSVPKWVGMDPHFKPRYTPWQQRLCMSPDGDFYEALREPNAEIRTGNIATIEEKGIRMAEGWRSTKENAPIIEKGKWEGSDLVEADAIVTATGLQMNFGGHIAVSVDGVPVRRWSKRIVWNGCMISDLPNFVFMFGYVNAAWTLGADDTIISLARIVRKMKAQNKTIATPRVPGRAPSDVLEKQAIAGETEVGEIETTSLWQLQATYVKEGQHTMPRYATFGPWRPRVNPPLDWFHARYGNVTNGLEFS